MDNVNFRGEEMKNLLRDLKVVNTWLGGNRITFQGVTKLMRKKCKRHPITLLDIGCGDGELLRKFVKFADKNNFKVHCIGVDFNENILEYAENQSVEFPNIKFQKVDVFLEQELLPNCDIAVCTLFMHHFRNNEIEGLLNNLIKKVNLGIVVNDLHRSRMAFQLFKIISFLFLKTKTAQFDGLVSIARGFKKRELKTFAARIPNQKSEIHWRWAFRYQWILKKEL
jgi:ubiquinone/menaquinone biosynthesis C-methylase UbiE